MCIRDRFITQQKSLGRDIVALDIPLLFETGAQSRVDYTIVVTAPYFIQQQRVLQRPNMTLEKFQKILDSQMPDKLKCTLGDFIVPTGLGKAYTYRCLESILAILKEK